MAITINSSSNLTAWEDTATDSHAMPTSTATKTFTVTAGKNFLAGDTVQATSTAAVIPTGIMGTVSSYSGTSLVIAPTNSVPSGNSLCGVWGRIYSKSTVTNGTGAKSFALSLEPEVAAALTTSLPVRIHSRVAPFTNFMVGTITSWTQTTGILVVNVTAATGSSSISDWIICQDGTFTSWDISPQWSDTWNINNASELSITQTPKPANKPRQINILTNGKMLITNSSTSTPLIFTGAEPTGAYNPNNVGIRVEQNGLWSAVGDFIQIGVATGAADETFAVPAGIDAPSYVEVETASAGIYEVYMIVPLDVCLKCAILYKINKSWVAPGTEMSKVLWWNPATRNLETGNGTTAGDVIPSGRKVRVPNIHITADPDVCNIITGNVSDSTTVTAISTGAGSKTFTVAAGLGYTATAAIALYNPTVPGAYLTGTVTSYDNGTGVMVANMTTSNGTATSATGWILRDARGPLLADVSQSSGTLATSNLRMYLAGEYVTATRTGNQLLSLTRNTLRELLTEIPVIGGYTRYIGAAQGGTGNGTRRWQIDTSPSGSLYFENVSFGTWISGDLTDPSSVTLKRVGWPELYIRNTLGTVVMEKCHFPPYSSPKQYHGARMVSMIGDLSIKDVYVWTTAPDSAGNAVSAFVISNAANVIKYENVRATCFYRRRSTAIVSHDTVVFATGVVAKDHYCVGAPLSLTGLNGAELEGFYFANQITGGAQTNEASMQHLNINRFTRCILRKFRPIGAWTLTANQLTSSDAFSSGLYIHDIDYSTDNNATATTGLCSNSGTSDLVIANANMGTVSATFANTLNRAASGLVEKGLTYRNIKTSVSGSIANQQGIPLSNGFRAEYVTTGQMYYNSGGGSCPSYKDCANFYVVVEPARTTGKLCIGPMSSEGAIDLYDLTGSAYVNNAGRLYLEADGDTAIIKNRYAIRSITSFVNAAPVLFSNASGTITQEFRFCDWGSDITAATWQTLDGATLSALTIADSDQGFDLQVRLTGVGASVGRYIEQIKLDTNNDSAFSPSVDTTDIIVSGAAVSAECASVELPRTVISSATASGLGVARLPVPFEADGITRTAIVRVRKYGYVQSHSEVSYYWDDVSVNAAQVTDANVTQSSGTASAHTGITVTDHGGSPVSWNSKNWGITITGDLTTNPALTATDIKHYIHYKIGQRASLSGYPGLTWHDMLPMATSETERGDYSAVYKGVRVIDQTGSPFVGFTRMQSDDGTYYNAPTTHTLSLPSLLENSRIRIINGSTEIDNSLVGPSGYTIILQEGTDYTAGDTIRFVATAAVGTTYYKPFFGSFTANSGTAEFSDAQAVWAEPTSIGLDWLAVTECATDFANLEVEVDDSDNLGYKSRYAIFMTGALTDVDGIRNWVDIATGETIIRWVSSASVIVDAALSAVTIINTKVASKLVVRDAFAFHWSDDFDRADAVLGASIIWQNPLEVATIETGTSGLTSGEAATLAKLDTLTEDVSGLRFTTKALETAPSGGGGLTAQQVRDALKLAPTAGTPDVGSIDASLATIPTTPAPTAAAVADAVWDEVLTGATHNVLRSAGRRLRQVTADIITEDMAAGSGSNNNQIILGSSASSTSGAYDPGLITIHSGAGAGQSRIILQYDGPTKTATVNRDWKTPVDNTSEYVITGYADIQSVNEGLVRSATTNTVRLNANAATVDDTYIGQIVFIVSGAGADQTAIITDYDGTTQTATIAGNWVSIPDSTSGYAILPVSPVLLAATNHIGATIPTVTSLTNGPDLSGVVTLTQIENSNILAKEDTVQNIKNGVAGISGLVA